MKIFHSKITEHCAAWHAYPESESPLNFLDESFESLLHTISTIKTKEKTPERIAIHLKLCKEFEGDLPAALEEARQAFNEAWGVWKAWEVLKARDKALDELVKARDGAVKALETALEVTLEETAKARQAMKALEAWEAALEKARPDIMKLHAEQCGCAWTPENNNIFEYMGTVK